MHIRSVVLVLGSIALVACAGTTDDTSGSSRTEQTKPVNKKTTSPGTTKETKPKADDTKTPAGSNGGIDGTWDITTLGSGTIGASEMTIKGGAISGVIVGDSEGTNVDGTCTVAKDRTSFKLTVTADTLKGTFTREFAYASADCGDAFSDVSEISATRTHADKNASGATALEGDWVIASEGEGSALAVSVTGLAAKAWSEADKKAGAAPVFTSLVKDGAASSTSSDTSLAFAARKR